MNKNEYQTEGIFQPHKEFKIEDTMKLLEELANFKENKRKAIILLPDTESKFNVLKIDEDIVKYIIPFLQKQQDQRNNGEKLILLGESNFENI